MICFVVLFLMYFAIEYILAMLSARSIYESRNSSVLLNAFSLTLEFNHLSTLKADQRANENVALLNK